MNGAARIAFVLCVASALSMTVEAATTTYVGNCDDIASHTGSASQTVQAFDFLQCCSSSLAKGYIYTVKANPTSAGTTYTAKVVKSSSNSGTMFGGHCEVYNGGGACSGSHCIWEPTGFGTRYYCDRDECCWEGSADNWCLNVQCRNNDGTACVFSDFTITFDAHTVSCAAGTDYNSNRGEYLDGATCQSCPANSVGAGGTATTCTCADGYYATKSGGNVNTCTACPTGSSKTGSTIFGDSAEETTSVCVANCAENKYWDGSACEDCPANSVGAGGTATTCTCAANYWAQKSGNTWTCELCSGGRTKAAGSTVLSGDGEVEDTVCVDATSCDNNHYLSGGECVACPDDSTSTEAASTACRCPDNEYAEWSNGGGGSWSCESCPDGTVKSGGSVIPQASEASDSCNADCASNQYWDGDSCEACPGNSNSAGGTATTCTCAANYWAKKSGNTWSCELCSGGRTKAAGSTVPGSGSSEDEDTVCADTTSCTDDHYLSGGKCVACPVGSTSTDPTSTTCECGANMYANNDECSGCSAGTFRTGAGAVVPGADETKGDVCLAQSCSENQYLKDGTCTDCAAGSTSAGGDVTTCVANCDANKYWDGDSCESCPGNSVGAGGTAESCTCDEGFYAKLTGGTWSCASCPSDSTRSGSVVPQTQSDTCVSSCASGKYWDGSVCQTCPANSDGNGGAETSCTCANDSRAVVTGSTWSCEECTGRQGSKIPQSSGASDECPPPPSWEEGYPPPPSWEEGYPPPPSWEEGYPPPPSWEEGYPPPPPTECTTEQYFDGSACQTCPDGSESTGGTAEYCTCAANTYASKSGNTWTCANCTGGGTKEAGSVVPGSGSGEKENDVCSTADSSGSNNPSPSQKSPSPSQKATETKEKAQKTRDTMLDGVTDAKLKKKAKLLADAAISGKKVRKMSAKLTASDADTACSDYYSKAGISNSLGACIATATSRRRSLAATAYDVSVFFSEAEVDDSTLTAAANSLKAEGVTGVDTSDPIDPITELGTIAGVDSSTLETFKTEAAEAAAMTPSSPPPPPMSPPPPKPAPPNLILDDDDGAVSVKGATRLALACALTTLALVL
jgi:hypothetical protein